MFSPVNKIIAEALGVKPKISWYVGTVYTIAFQGDGTKVSCEEWYKAHKKYCDFSGKSVRELIHYPPYNADDSEAMKGIQAMTDKGITCEIHFLPGRKVRVCFKPEVKFKGKRGANAFPSIACAFAEAVVATIGSYIDSGDMCFELPFKFYLRPEVEELLEERGKA